MVHSSFTEIHLYKGMNSCTVRPIKSEDPLPEDDFNVPEQVQSQVPYRQDRRCLEDVGSVQIEEYRAYHYDLPEIEIQSMIFFT